MAGLVDEMAQTNETQELMQLMHNPMFGHLQAELTKECTHVSIPYTLMSDSSRAGDQAPIDDIDLIVEDATLQAEFRQLAPMNDPRVTQLEIFYNTQSASIVTQRSDAMMKVHNSSPVPHQLETDLTCVNKYYNRQQAHLTIRISKSLQLLKCSLPKDVLPPAGITKKSGGKGTRLLNGRAVGIMSDWYNGHIEHPYPTDEEKLMLAEDGGISLAQVKAWFANKRNRTLNTKPKRQKMKMQQQLTHICDKLIGDVPKQHGKQKSYNTLLEEISGLVHVSQDTYHASYHGLPPAMTVHKPVTLES